MPDPTRRSERSRHAILTAAHELVGEVGYRKLTIEAIAARAGVGKQTIYRWWPSKGAVVLDAMLATVSDPADLALPDTGDVDADLRGVVHAIVAELADPTLSGTSRALMIEIQEDPGLAESMVERILGPNLAAIADRLRAAQDAGQLRRDLDLSVAVEMIVGPLYHRWLLRTAPLTPAYADTVTDLALRALAPDRLAPHGEDRLE
ncbi:TetR/AcrR family transcriptional regulator [Pseudonocardia sichuanensis]|uniref:TetR family transcriptional regulator n=1 Tax=Pseudonocardia kunmingensis TaxID=630975 RepID=A0A543E198_9PSEU|nr:TetR/AcrR family transcriptional regulator [Pseudonocardia kunmingensis]TQM15363.1 TetR family transcriptional regulator [Pseudonocardia kunmingensis]